MIPSIRQTNLSRQKSEVTASWGQNCMIREFSEGMAVFYV